MLYDFNHCWAFYGKELLEMLSQLRFPALSMVILLAIAVAVAHLFLIDKKHQGLFVSMFLILIRFCGTSYQSSTFWG